MTDWKEDILNWLDFYSSCEMLEAQGLENKLIKIVEEVEARAKEEGTREERELIVKLQMIRLGIQVFNKSEQERDEEEKRGLIRRDGGRTLSALSLIKQIDTELENLTKKD